MLELVQDALRNWYRTSSRASPGARLLEPAPGVLGAVTPAVPERSLPNGVLYRDVDAFESTYEQLDAAYSEARVAWTVWVQPEGRERAAALLSERGHVLDAQPLGMVLRLDRAPARPARDALEHWTGDGDIHEVGPLNDAAYGYETDSFTRLLAGLPAEAARTYTAALDGRSVGCLLMVDEGPNTDVMLVAVEPEARGRGIAGSLLAHALNDAAERGQETATLVATKLGAPVYERLGFEAVGDLQMWERRPGAVTPG